QHRRGLRETYENEEPMTGCWATTEVFDWASGIYGNGYGPTLDEDGKALGRDHDLMEVRHERTVVFVRPDYYVVIDRMLGEGEHTYSNLFHLDADEASVDEETLVVSTQAEGLANITLVPVAMDGLTLRVVKGQEDPVQGWLPRQKHRPIPTPIYEKTGAPPQLFVTVLLPHPTIEVPEFSAELLAETEGMVALRLASEGGEDIVLYEFEAPLSMQAGGVTAQARLAVVRRAADGEVRAGLLGGTELRVDGQAVSPVTPDEM
ncbi:MAG: heparinase II/III family protein, partial [Planctomycetes bacterium]|nr:heparinase II/III family protein [Planctomycetota bacterium]